MNENFPNEPIKYFIADIAIAFESITKISFVDYYYYDGGDEIYWINNTFDFYAD